MSQKPDASNKQNTVREALVRLLAIQFLGGMTAEEVEASIRRCVVDARQLASKSASQLPGSDAQNIGNILRNWHRQSAFLTKDGFPRPLTLSGKFGLDALILTEYSKQQLHAVRIALQKARLIRKTREGRWLPTSRYAVFPSLSQELIAHLSEGVLRLVETITRNVRQDSKDLALFERSAKVHAFPIARAAEFREFTRDQAILFLNAVDDWMEAKAAGARIQRGRTCTAGVFTFAFMDDPPRRASPRSKARGVRLQTN